MGGTRALVTVSATFGAIAWSSARGDRPFGFAPLVQYPNSYPLVPSPFTFCFHHFEPTDLGGRANVRAAVSLLVEADDVDDADLVHCCGDEVDLGADEVFILHGRVARQERDGDLTVLRDLRVHQVLHARRKTLGKRVEC